MSSIKYVLAAILVSFAVFSAPASANTLTYQGVTFQTLSSGNTLTLIITNALSGGTGNWANINYLNAFEIKGIGNVAGASLTGWSTNLNNGLSTNTSSGGSGCTTGGTKGGGTKGACFSGSSAIQLTDLMTFNIDFKGTNLDFSAPHLKVQFFNQQYQKKATGSLLSKDITAPVPEPEIYAMMGIGMGVLGWVARKKKMKATVA